MIERGLYMPTGRVLEERSALGFNRVTLLAVVVAFSATDIVLANVGPTIYLTEALIWAVCGACLFLSATSDRRDAVWTFVTRMPFAVAYGVWIALAALVALGLAGSSEQIGKVKNVLPALLLAATILHMIRTRAALLLMLTAIMIGAAANGALSLAQFFSFGLYPVEPLDNAIWKTGLDGDYKDAVISGFFGSANALGSALLPAIIIGTSIFFKRLLSSRYSRLLILFYLTLSIAGLVASANKGAIIWSFVGIFIVLWPFRFRGLLAGATVVSVVAGIILVSLSFGSSHTDRADTILARVRILEAFFDQVQERPSILLYGDGVEGFAAKTVLLGDWRMDATHNTWSDQIFYFGIPGLVFYATFWTTVLRTLSVAERRALGQDRELVATLLAAAAAIGGSIFFEPRADGVFNVAQIFMLLALGLVAARLAKEQRPWSVSPLGRRSHRRSLAVYDEHA